MATGPQTIYAARLFDGERWLRDQAVEIDGGTIRAVRARAQGEGVGEAVLAPGLVDLQVNGGGGVLLNDAPTPDAVTAIVAAHRGLGTAALVPTLISDTREAMRTLFAHAAEIFALPGVAGLHLEGPFLNPKRKGVHPEAALRAPDAEDEALIAGLAARGPTMVTLAPEMVPRGFIRAIARAGARVMIGHSEATAAEVLGAADDGAIGATHLFNAMSQLTPREPGVVGAVLAGPRLRAGIIADGMHVDALGLRVALTCLGPARLALVSDAMPTVGSAATSFVLQGRTITLDGGRLTTAEGTLAGAHLSLAGAVREMIAATGADRAAALRMTTLTPAEILGVQGQLGRIAPGFAANLTALEDDLKPVAVWVAGRRFSAG